MTVSTTTRKAGPFIGNGVTVAFPFSFKVFSKTDLSVILTDAAGAETVLDLDADYSAALNADQDNNPGGVVTYSYGGIPLPSTQKLTILSDVPLLQPTDIQNRGGFYPSVIEDALDRVTILSQQVKELLGRAIRFAVSDGATNAELPTAAARAGKAIVFDENGNIAVSDAGWQVEVTHGNVIRTTHVKGVGFVAGGTTLFLPSDGFLKENVHILFAGTGYGVELQQTAFSLNGATITLTNPIPSDVEQIETWYIQPLAVGSINDGVVTDAKVAANAGIDANKLNFVNRGTGAVSRTVREKLRDTACILDYKDYPGSDWTTAHNNAVAAARRVYYPAGTYQISSGNWPSDTELYGDGDSTILLMQASASYLLTCNSGSSSTANNITNLRMRDMQLQATCDVDGLSEFKHLVAISGVTNVLFENVLFKGFRGDGLYVGSGAAGQERHNKNVTVRRCRFDGINRQNRNAISFIDIDGGLVEGTYFANCTSAAMPGAIDCEPDANAWAIIKNVTVRRCTFDSVGGNVGAVSVFVPAAVTQAAQNITVEECVFTNYLGTGSCVFFSDNRTPSATSTENNLKLVRNVGSGGCRPFFVYGKRITLDANTWTDFTNSAVFAFSGISAVWDVDSRYNRYTRVGSTDGNGLSVFTASYVTFTGDKFIDCGTGVAGSANAIDFNTGTSSNIKFDSVEFSSPTGKTQIAIQKEAGHTFTPGANSFIRSTATGLSNFFLAEESDSIETTFSPVVTGSTTSGAGTYSTQLGRYRRLGKLVFFRIKLAVNAGHTGSGIIQVGLPTTVAAGVETVITLALEGVNLTAAPGAPVGRIDPNLVVNSVGAIRCYQTASLANNAAAVIPATAFTIYAEGFYVMP